MSSSNGKGLELIDQKPGNKINLEHVYGKNWKVTPETQ